MFDENNAYLLGKLVGSSQYKTRKFGEEYEKLVRPVLTSWFNNKPCRERLIFSNQTGGTLYTLSTPKESIEVEVEEMMSITENEKDEEIRYKIIFFHPSLAEEFREKGAANFLKHCLLVKIFNEERMAEISDLNRYYPCIEPKVLKYGRTLVRGAIFYLEKNKKRLGINKIELQDEAAHWCEGKPYYPIKMVYSRQLLGEIPYYWQFGFRPITHEVTKIIGYNMSKARNFTIDKEVVDGKNIINYIVSKLEFGQELYDIIAEEYTKHEKLYTFLQWLSDNFCVLYFHIYDDLFRDLKLLDPYRGVNSRWRLELD